MQLSAWTVTNAVLLRSFLEKVSVFSSSVLPKTSLCVHQQGLWSLRGAVMSSSANVPHLSPFNDCVSVRFSTTEKHSRHQNHLQWPTKVGFFL